jgi:hypothetical protein
MHRQDVERLDASRTYWVPSIISPRRDWAGAPGCRRGARFLVDTETLAASRDEFSPFDTESSCLEWIMRNRARLTTRLPGASVRPVRLDRWLLGLD